MNSAVRAVLILRAIGFAVVVGSSALGAQAQERMEIQKPVPEANGDIEALEEALLAIEADRGAYASTLSEQLYSLGRMLQQENRHTEAISAFRRGTHLSRVNQGLYNLEQIPFIQGEISSDLAIGELEDADQRQAYLLKVQRHSLPSGEALIKALMKQAEWQKRAYEHRIGGDEDSFIRLQAMWDLYSSAIQDISRRESPTSINLIPPLMGLMKTQYMISTHYSQARRRSVQVSNQQTQFDIEFAQSYRMGKSIIQSIYEVELSCYGPHSLPAAKTMVLLGDWMMWNKKRDSAQRAYTAALQELNKLGDAKTQIENIFGKPVPLPDIDGIRWLPAVAEPGEGKVLLEFGVNKRGRVFDMARLDKAGKDDKKVQRLMKKIHNRQFRSRYEGMKPVDTEKVLWAYDIK